MLFRTLALSLGMLLAAPHLAQTFTNASPITIPDSGPASPYASTINVSGTSFPSSIRITLNGLTHSNTADLDILLLAPDSTKILLLSDIGSTNPATRATTNSTVSFEYRSAFTVQAGGCPRAHRLRDLQPHHRCHLRHLPRPRPRRPTPAS